MRDPGPLLSLALMAALVIRALWRQLLEIVLISGITLVCAGVIGVLWLLSDALEH